MNIDSLRKWPKKWPKNWFLYPIVIGLLSITFIIGYSFTNKSFYFRTLWVNPIKVGILHSLTGTMSISEKPIVDTLLMAIKKTNEQGGLLGRPLLPVIIDGESDDQKFSEGAEKLIAQENVSVVFGCWTSASRKTVKPIFEKYNHLLFYPVQYEGLEESKNIIYTGATPNQQIVPGVFWAFNNLGKKFFLVGSDYVFPRIANIIIKEQIASLGGEIVGEEYLPLGSNNVTKMIEKIKTAQPNVILNTINGDTNIAFFKGLRAAGITSFKIPTISFSIAEQELLYLPLEEMIGDYTVWGYFQSINTPDNADFLLDFQQTYPTKPLVMDDPMEAAYLGFQLWIKAVKEAQSPTPEDVLKVIGTQTTPAPEGVVYVDPQNHHTWKYVRIGKIRFDRQFTIVWNSEKQIDPIPYLPYRKKEDWEKSLKAMYEGWGNKWSK